MTRNRVASRLFKRKQPLQVAKGEEKKCREHRKAASRGEGILRSQQSSEEAFPGEQSPLCDSPGGSLGKPGGHTSETGIVTYR
jgi:hypothetical protein